MQFYPLFFISATSVNQNRDNFSQPWNIGNQQHNNHANPDEGPNLFYQAFCSTFDGTRDKEVVGTKRGRDRADRTVKDHHNAEVDQIDIQSGRHRGQERRNDHHASHAIEEHAENGHLE